MVKSGVPYIHILDIAHGINFKESLQNLPDEHCKNSSLQDLYTMILVAAQCACKKVNDVEIVSLCSYLVHCTLYRSKIRVSYDFLCPVCKYCVAKFPPRGIKLV